MNNRLRIGFDATWIARYEKSGVGYYIEALIKAIAVNYPGIELIGFYFSGKDTAPPTVKAPNLHFIRNRFWSQKTINLLRRLGIEIPCELFIGKRVNFFIFPSYLSHPSLRGTPSAVIIHDLAFIDMPETVSKRNRQTLVNLVPRSLRRCSFVITNSNVTKKRIKDYYNVSKEIVVIDVPPSVGEAIKQPGKAMLREFNIHKKYLFFIGNIEPRKNILRIIEAYSRLEQKLRSKYSLVLAGGAGWNNDEIIKRIKELQNEGIDIILTGYVNNSQRQLLYQYATVFVFPSLYEGFGMPVLEAMYYNLPVITSDIPVLREVCGNAALYCNPLNVDDISSKLTEILEDPKLRQYLVNKGRANLKKFSWQDNAAIIYEHISQVVKNE